ALAELAGLIAQPVELLHRLLADLLCVLREISVPRAHAILHGTRLQFHVSLRNACRVYVLDSRSRSHHCVQSLPSAACASVARGHSGATFSGKTPALRTRDGSVELAPRMQHR